MFFFFPPIVSFLFDADAFAVSSYPFLISCCRAHAFSRRVHFVLLAGCFPTVVLSELWIFRPSLFPSIQQVHKTIVGLVSDFFNSIVFFFPFPPSGPPCLCGPRSVPSVLPNLVSLSRHWRIWFFFWMTFRIRRSTILLMHLFPLFSSAEALLGHVCRSAKVS